MQDLLLYIIQNLVSKPDQVKIEESNQEGAINFNLTVDPTDMGLVIGKGGQTIKAIRRLLGAKAMGENSRDRVFVNLQEQSVPA